MHLFALPQAHSFNQLLLSSSLLIQYTCMGRLNLTCEGVSIATFNTEKANIMIINIHVLIKTLTLCANYRLTYTVKLTGLAMLAHKNVLV